MALVANCRPTRSRREFTPFDFHPYRTHRIPKTKDLSILKALFVDGPARNRQAGV